MNFIASHPAGQPPPPHPAAELAARIDAILAALLLVIGAHQRILGRFALPVWTRISRLRRRFARLLARPLTHSAVPRQNATPPAANRPETVRNGGPPAPYIPRRHGWLVHVIGYQAAAAMSHFEHLFRDPAIQQLLATASPRWICAVGRPLRPLCRLLHVTPPPVFMPPGRQRPVVMPRPPARRRDAAPPSPPPPPRTASPSLDGLHPPTGLNFIFRPI